MKLRVTAILLTCFSAWLPCAHYATRLDLTQLRRGLTHYQTWAWESGEVTAEQSRMSVTNPEWDYMGRTFLVLSLVNQVKAKQLPQSEALPVIDRIIDDTVGKDQSKFLMQYGKHWSGQSVFYNGELALMLEARLRLGERGDYRDRAKGLLFSTYLQMQRSPVLSAESYPNECWTFCNTVALTAMKMEGSTYQPFIDQWLVIAKTHLVDPNTGILVSSYKPTGEFLDGPEGSSIWSVTHFLSALDPVFARDQYRLAKTQLSGKLLGFAYSREWPESWEGPVDVDSGPVVFGVSPGASGQAILAAATFRDAAYVRGLADSACMFAVPDFPSHGTRFLASNQVGDAMMLYALSQGPLWEEIR